MTDPYSFLRHLFERAVAVADPMVCVPNALPPKPAGRCFVIGAGKASARMAEALESVWGPCAGRVITRYGYARPCKGITIVEAAHPVPDAAGLSATADLLSDLAPLTEDDTVIALISGGASALLVQPAGDITLQEKQAVNAALLASGAPIDKMNTVRKHLSRVKGGQLAAAAYPATVHALIISDVAGDDPAFIASGPTVGDSSTPADVRAILKAYAIDVPASVDAVLRTNTGVLPPEHPFLAKTINTVIAAPSQSLEEAGGIAEGEGLTVRMLGDAIEGEAREVAAEHAALAQEIRMEMTAQDRPCLLLSGGECTVTRRGDGIGGPNAEYALALAVALDAAEGIFALAGDTDGVDGAAEVAGARIGPDTLARAEALGLSAQAALAKNDSHSFFAAMGDQIVTGPTLTNVNDFRAILILPPEA
ncbi:glycerate kinase [Cognatishimia sp. F0-27]|uniref:glycerate kinase type-2 family protein n=1 Tax=Cognatishimia sp. F0-27 TaxID=2816855 RepID=UPI001D0C944D|nr:glycerate kinase [Cognatishimia sp. F0-27]MCC1492921.1 glycerate kinase [Cognatishimia sp. F0-27]